ncbi:DOMON domain-containing protein FRRS1L-like [Dreissena polymorpha]|uniref:DOMON domain-containing protein FRRS1L-like n=1 Tax=Dreissena polymorpha TaxID=45954 RepID=UPI0022651702|nr:DOMON domain-containing protein FRRS1L-like [Dreissena polymorpha]
MTKPSECGHSKKCFRYGADGCGHMGCKYFLSYNVSGNALDMEMSARTSGWVAVGFSSDTRMGGDDEVILCSTVKSTQSGEPEVQAATYVNTFPYVLPIKNKGTEIVTVVQGKNEDGYIYCHIRRPLSADKYMDLTNGWYQLYAFGPVLIGGDIEKHSETPKISVKISLLQQMNEFINCASLPALSISIFGFVIVAVLIN